MLDVTGVFFLLQMEDSTVHCSSGLRLDLQADNVAKLTCLSESLEVAQQEVCAVQLLPEIWQAKNCKHTRKSTMASDYRNLGMLRGVTELNECFNCQATRL